MVLVLVHRNHPGSGWALLTGALRSAGLLWVPSSDPDPGSPHATRSSCTCVGIHAPRRPTAARRAAEPRPGVRRASPTRSHTYPGSDRLGSQRRLRGRRIGSVSSKWKLSPVGLEVSPLWNKAARKISPKRLGATDPLTGRSEPGPDPSRPGGSVLLGWDLRTEHPPLLQEKFRSAAARQTGATCAEHAGPPQQSASPRLSLSWCHQKRSGRLPQTFTRCSLSAAGTGPSSGSSPAGRTGPKNSERTSRETSTNWTNAAAFIVSINTFKLLMCYLSNSGIKPLKGIVYGFNIPVLKLIWSAWGREPLIQTEMFPDPCFWGNSRTTTVDQLSNFVTSAAAWWNKPQTCCCPLLVEEDWRKLSLVEKIYLSLVSGFSSDDETEKPTTIWI